MVGHFDDRAGTWDDDPRRVARAEQAAQVIRATLPLRPGMRMLDLGAGTGLLSQALVDDVGSLVLADPSQGMRDVAERKAASGLFGERVRVIHPDELDESAPGEFDLVVALMALHHIEDLPTALGRLGRALAPGGLIAVVDLERDVEETFHDPGFTGHQGFDRSEIAQLLKDAGFGGVAIRHCLAMPKNDRTYDLFLATARTPENQAGGGPSSR